MLPGEVSTIEIPRAQPDLGISMVGGCDTPLVSIFWTGHLMSHSTNWHYVETANVIFGLVLKVFLL